MSSNSSPRSSVEFTASMVSVISRRCRSERFIPAMIGAVSTYQWALLFHLVGAFVYIGGMILSETTWFRARRGTSSSEIRTLLDLSKLGETISAVGALVLFGFAFWLDRSDAVRLRRCLDHRRADALRAPGNTDQRRLEATEARESDRPRARRRCERAEPGARPAPTKPAPHRRSHTSRRSWRSTILVLMVWKPGA